MAAPSFVAVGSQASGTTGSVSYPLPAGIADGDTLIAGIESSATTGVTTSTPGWANVAGSPRAQGSNTLAVNALIDTYTSGDGNLVGAGSNNHQTGAIAAFRGVGGVDATSNNSGNSASPTGLGITTTVDDCLVVWVAVWGADTATPQFTNEGNTSLTGVTVHYEAGTTNGNGGGLLIASGVKATAGAVAAWTADLAASQTWAAIVIALAPATAAPPGAGSGSGTVTVAGSGSGQRLPVANGSSTVTASSTASGRRSPVAAGSGSVAVSGSGVGKRIAKGAGASVVATAGSGAGKRIPRSSGVGNALSAGTSVGRRQPRSSGNGTVITVGNGTGAAPVVGGAEGSGSGAISTAGTASGRRTPKSSGVGTVVVGGSGTGRRIPVAFGAGATTVTTTAVGYILPGATGTGTAVVVGSGIGQRPGEATDFAGRILAVRLSTQSAKGRLAATTATGRLHHATAVGEFTIPDADADLSIPQATGVLT